jgi:hypothetical protein
MSARGRLLLGFGLVFASAVLLVGGVLAVRWAMPRPAAPPASRPDDADEAYAREFDRRMARELELLAGRIDDPERGPIRCRLRASPDSPDSLETEIVNVGPQPVRLWYETFGLEYHVTLVLREPNGRPVSHLRWALYSSQMVIVDPQTGRPAEEVPVITLRPGESERHPVQLSLLFEELASKVPSGRYAVQALFTYSDLGGFPEPNRDLFARSAPVPVEVGTDGMRVVRD